MQIRIDRNASKDLQLKKLVLNKFSIKFYVAIAAILILGSLLVFLSINEINGIKLPFWNLGSALGLGFIMIGLVRVRDLRRRRSFSLVNNSNSIITINEEKNLSLISFYTQV